MGFGHWWVEEALLDRPLARHIELRTESEKFRIGLERLSQQHDQVDRRSCRTRLTVRDLR